MPTVQELIDLNALSDWMDTQGLEQGELKNARLLTGGTQNILMQFERGNTSYVLRRPPIHGRDNSNKTMQREAQVLAALAGSDVPHPGFIASCPETDVLGASFYLMKPIIGFNAINGLPEFHHSNSKVKHRMGLSYIESLAKLGAVDYKAVGLESFGKPDGYLKRQVPRWLAQLESYAKVEAWPGLDKTVGIDVIAKWLENNCPDTFIPGIIHGDAHIGNVMFANDSPEIAALIDWELATIGDPLIDLGWIMATWPEPDGKETLPLGGLDINGFPSIEELIKHYGENSTRDLRNISWYGVLGCFKLAIILEGTYVRYCAGKAPKNVAEMLHGTTLRLLERAHKLIEQS